MWTTGSAHSHASSHADRSLRIEDPDDDKRSSVSRESGSPRTERVDILRLVAGDRVRRARCSPEFLVDLATRSPYASSKLTPIKFKILNGTEAQSSFNQYLSDHLPLLETSSSSRHSHDHDTKLIGHPSPIVFSVNAWEGGQKCVDYYMTWRGYNKMELSKGDTQRITQLDADFRRLAKKLDGEFERLASLKLNGIPMSHRSEKSKRSSHRPRRSRPPPEITISDADKTDGDPSLPTKPSSATDSVMSLPLLNMVRGVPFSHRVPLRVTNPDRLSMISDTDGSPVGPPQPKLSEANLANLNKSMASFDIEEVKQTLSASVGAHKSSPDGKIKKPSASSPSGSKSSEPSARPENRQSRNSDKVNGVREKSSLPEEGSTYEFTIVILGEDVVKDARAWHGLVRPSCSTKAVPVARQSPWMPLPGRPSSTSYAESSDSEESEEESAWAETPPPVVPMRSLLEASGMVPSPGYYRPSVPVVPSISGYTINYAQHGSHPSHSPASMHSPYLYSSPQPDPAAYPPWISPLPVYGGQPLSDQVYTPASYLSPYVAQSNF